MEIDTHLLATIIMVVETGRCCQWMLSHVVEVSEKDQPIGTVLD